MEKRAHKSNRTNSHHRSFENNTAKNRVEGRVVRGRELPLGMGVRLGVRAFGTSPPSGGLSRFLCNVHLPPKERRGGYRFSI